jgi:hypothetical protein
MEMGNEDLKQYPTPELTPAVLTEEQKAQERKGKIALVVIGIVAILLVIAIIVGIILLLRADPTTTAQIRDVFIIVMAFESLLLGFVLILLLIQVARLTNLLRNEIIPILDSTNETVSTLRGTSVFLSENLVQPVLKLNEYAAAISQIGTILGIARKKNKNKNHTS